MTPLELLQQVNVIRNGIDGNTALDGGAIPAREHLDEISIWLESLIPTDPLITRFELLQGELTRLAESKGIFMGDDSDYTRLQMNLNELGAVITWLNQLPPDRQGE